MPEQFKHTNIPSVYEAQSGSSDNKSNKHVNKLKLPQSEKTERQAISRKSRPNENKDYFTYTIFLFHYLLENDSFEIHL